jgi:YggT family protein
MIREAFQFLLDALLQPFAAILLFRFHAVWLRAPMRNGLGEFIMVLTDFLVLRARRYIPRAWGYDSASLLLALVVETIYVAASAWTQGFPLEGFPLLGWLAWAAVKLMKLSVDILILAVLALAVLSWLGKPTTFGPLLAAIANPFLKPLRRITPLLGQIDITPMLLFIICQLILIVPLGMLEHLALRLLS